MKDLILKFFGQKNKVAIPVIIIIIIIIIVAIMILSVNFLQNYVQESIHDERTVYLTSQTKTIADLVNSTINRYDEYAQVCGKFVEDELKEEINVQEFMTKKYPIMGIPECNCMLVDENLTWYGKNGETGRITAPEYYAQSTEKSIRYMTTGVDADVESIVYRLRLDNPIQVKTNTGTTVIEYVIVAYYLDDLHNIISNALPYKCNRFIMDKDGIMLYKNFELGVILPGSNIMKKYDKVNFLYDDSSEEQKNLIEGRNIAVGEFIANDTNYFICSAPLDINGWSVVFVIDNTSLSAGAYVPRLLQVVGLVATIFALAIIATVIAVFKSLETAKIVEKERMTNEALEKASVAKSTFLANMSHDIRTPINGIMGMTQIARQQKNPKKTQECLDKIDGASHHLLSLVNDVLDMSSIESGKVKITNKPLDIRTLCDNCSSIVHGQIGDRNLNFVTEFDDLETPFIMADELHLRQVIINILSNAIKYTPDGGTIWYRMRAKSASGNTITLRFEVEDTGVGMKPEFLSHIWDSFSQEEGGSRTSYKGTGLGMTITKKFVELMGGEITVQSTYEIGSTFVVEIPFEVTSSINEEKDEKIGEVLDISGCKILLAEDNDLNLEIAMQLLGDEGAEITPAMNGMEAIKAFRDNPIGTFDLILMDVMMPEVDGIEATKIIRAMGREDAKTIPILAMTANAFEEDIKATHEAGMNAHLSKPINMKEVVKTISNFYKTDKEEE